MTIEEFLQELYGDELSDMFAGNRISKEDSRIKLLPLMNTAMSQAYAKWKVKFNSEMITVVEGTTEYELVATDVLQVTQLINVYGLEIPTNEYQVYGKTIYIPYPINQELEVVYKVTHTKYTTAQDDSLVEVELPEMLIPWLKAYVCYRFFAAMKTEEAMVKAADFLSQATMAENIFLQTNTTGEFTAPTPYKLEGRGFA